MNSRPSHLPVLMVGLSHKVSSVEQRERLAFHPERVPATLQQLLADQNGSIEEAVLLSTCNRTEFYVCSVDPDGAETFLHAFMARHASMPVDQLQAMVCTLYGEAAAQHLMQVACGLDSLVLGENEILGQVRTAGELAHTAGTAGPILLTLFRDAVHAGKRARAETEIGSRNISVASVVVELAEQAFGSLHDRTALLIGAGKISTMTARLLNRTGLHCIMVANRTFERAEKLAQSLGGQAVHFDRLDQVLLQADIVICSTGAPHIILHAGVVEKAQEARRHRTLLLVDLAVPRDVDPAAAGVSGVRLADIDDLETIVKTDHALTDPVCGEVNRIIREELDRFLQWVGVRRCVAVIQVLHQRAADICQAEVEQTLRRLGPLTPHQEHLIQAMGKAIARKLLYQPTAHLRESSSQEEVGTFLELVRELYAIQ